jgi:hypothetical protein
MLQKAYQIRKRRGLLERLPNLEETLTYSNTSQNQKPFACDLTPLTPSTYKMCTKLKEEGL